MHSPSATSPIPAHSRHPVGGPFIAGLVTAMAMVGGALAWSEAGAQGVSGATGSTNASTRAAAPAATAQASTAPGYSTGEIDRAFSFIDSNRDGKISREEASGFRGVARHFDEADTNKDNALSREEFGTALNASKKS